MFVNSTSLATYETDATATRRLESARRAATDKMMVAIDAVHDLEVKLNIERTWTEDDREYQDAARYLQHRDFHRALDRVQQLIVQRLFEMSKANIVGIGNVFFKSFLYVCTLSSSRLQNAYIYLEGLEAAWQGNTHGPGQIQQTRNANEPACANIRLEEHRQLYICLGVQDSLTLLLPHQSSVLPLDLTSEP